MKILVTPSSQFTKNQMNDLTVGIPAVNILDRIRHNTIWKERSMMEENENYRQVIPYILVQNRDTGMFLLSRRTSKQEEARLHDKYSIGIGGHIDFHDPYLSNRVIITEAAHRELQEETGWVTDGDSLLFQGIILTDTEPVDRVHVGILYHYITELKDPHSEDGKHEHEWADCERLLQVYGKMERWSQIVFDSYISFI
jgi:predicted NUDIX family phosphoesterase